MRLAALSSVQNRRTLASPGDSVWQWPYGLAGPPAYATVQSSGWGAGPGAPCWGPGSLLLITD